MATWLSAYCVLVLFALGECIQIERNEHMKLESDGGARSGAPPSSPHYENTESQTGTDKQIAEMDRSQTAGGHPPLPCSEIQR